MKVLIISPLFPSQGSGAEISTMLECRELVENGVEVVLVTNSHVKLKCNDMWMKKIKSYQIPMSFISFIHPKNKPFGEFLYWFLQECSWKYISKTACEEKADLIHIEHAFIGFNKNDNWLPIIMTIRDYWPICPYRVLMNKEMKCCANRNFIGGFPCRWKIYSEYGATKFPHLFYNVLFTPILYLMYCKYHEIVKEKLKEIDQILTISNFVKDVIKSHIPLEDKEIEVIYTPIVTREYVPRKDSDEITFTYIGALEAHKGIMNLVKAFSIVTRKNSNVRLLICGEGALRPRIREFILGNNLTKNIKLLGRVNYETIDRVYEETDIVIVPSLWPEPFGRVVAESLISGRLVLINPVGGLKEQVDDGINGFYANCYDIKQLAEKMLELASYPKDEIILMGIKAREYTLKKFNPYERVKKLIRIYERLIMR